MSKDLLQFTSSGLYCPLADVYLDPWKPVKRAIISHAHSDHTTFGTKYYLAHRDSAPLMKWRLGEDINLEAKEYGEKFLINGVTFSLHPAGHIPGSAQIRVSYKGDVWVFTGDFKPGTDNLCVPFEPVVCNTLITESTFGLPIFQWKPEKEMFTSINAWWKSNKEKGMTSILAGWSLGKAQRLIKGLDHTIGPVFSHGAVHNMNLAVERAGFDLPHTEVVQRESKKSDFEGAIIVCPPSALGSPWLRRFPAYSTAIASGWMQLRGTRRRRAADRGFALSDHADWQGLNETVKETQAERIIATHGYTYQFSQWLRDQGLDAQAVETQFVGENLEAEPEQREVEQ